MATAVQGTTVRTPPAAQPQSDAAGDATDGTTGTTDETGGSGKGFWHDFWHHDGARTGAIVGGALGATTMLGMIGPRVIEGPRSALLGVPITLASMAVVGAGGAAFGGIAGYFVGEAHEPDPPLQDGERPRRHMVRETIDVVAPAIMGVGAIAGAYQIGKLVLEDAPATIGRGTRFAHGTMGVLGGAAFGAFLMSGVGLAVGAAAGGVFNGIAKAAENAREGAGND